MPLPFLLRRHKGKDIASFAEKCNFFLLSQRTTNNINPLRLCGDLLFFSNKPDNFTTLSSWFFNGDGKARIYNKYAHLLRRAHIRRNAQYF